MDKEQKSWHQKNMDEQKDIASKREAVEKAKKEKELDRKLKKMRERDPFIYD
jgi:hypothetical protein|tara:strand:+ start:2562 stop:2717 length:156 start_codon:yes stop_codon:yes gene_type:complete